MGRLVGWILLFVGSEALGLGLAEWFYRLFLKAVPPASMSAVSQGASHAVYLLYGAGAGVAIFGWSWLCSSIAATIAGRRASATVKPAAIPATPPQP
jgi:hypothetical protein